MGGDVNDRLSRGHTVQLLSDFEMDENLFQIPFVISLWV